MSPVQRHTNTPQPLPQAGGRREPTSAVSPETISAEFAVVLDRSGLHSGLGYLNGRVRFRFTGLYRFEPPVLVNESLYDRENRALDQSGTVLNLPDTYCEIARRTREVFVTENAPEDPRLNGHSARHTVISYTGMPIRMPTGLIAGVLCHYDLRPRILPPEELAVLQEAAVVLAQWLGPTLCAASRPARTP